MAIVVRCTGCRGASQVGPEALGLLVICPRCQEPFLAIEEAPAVSLKAAKPRRERAQPLAPESPPIRRRVRAEVEPVAPSNAHDPHDPPIAPTSGLPATVLIGFALLPFAIPLLWLIGPLVLKQQPALSLAAPASLALSAAVLCLAVVFTVDWTPATRIKGVLMLVGLSYFAGLSLYFLKKDMVDRTKEFLTPAPKWYSFYEPKGKYHVRLPFQVTPDMTSPDQPLTGWTLRSYRLLHHPPLSNHSVTYSFGAGPDAKKNDPNWTAEVTRVLQEAAGNQADVIGPAGVSTLDQLPGLEWTLTLADRRTVRIVRIFRANDMIYYFAVEGENLDPDNSLVRTYYNSLQINSPAGK
jgi:hypothetical protein